MVMVVALRCVCGYAIVYVRIRAVNGEWCIDDLLLSVVIPSAIHWYWTVQETLWKTPTRTFFILNDFDSQAPVSQQQSKKKKIAIRFCAFSYHFNFLSHFVTCLKQAPVHHLRIRILIIYHVGYYILLFYFSLDCNDGSLKSPRLT